MKIATGLTAVISKIAIALSLAKTATETNARLKTYRTLGAMYARENLLKYSGRNGGIKMDYDRDEQLFLTMAKLLAEKHDVEIGFDLETNTINYNCDGKKAEAIAMELVEMFDKHEKQAEQENPEHYLMID